MDVLLTSFSVEVVKIAAEKSKRQSYPAAMLAAAPVALAQSVADVPRGAIDTAVERKLLRKRTNLGKTVQSGIARGGGRLGAGLVTTPMFMAGIKKIRDAKTPEERRKGTLQVLGAGAAFSALKGGIEAAGERGLTREQRIGKIKALATSRGITGILAAGLTARAVAKSLEAPKKGESKPSVHQRFVAPALAGAAIGAAKGGWDKAYELGAGKTLMPGGARKVRAAAGGRAAAGMLGAVALSEIMRRALPKPKEKTATVMPPGHEGPLAHEGPFPNNPQMPVNFGPKPRDIYDEVEFWSQKRTPEEVYRAYQHSMRTGQAEATPSRRAAHYALVDNLQSRGVRVPPPPMRRSVQGKVRAPGTVDTVALAAVVAAPPVAFLALESMEPTAKDKVLREAMDRLIASKHISVVSSDSPDFVTNMFDPSSGKIHLHEKASPSVAAHELGHARAGTMRKQFLQNPAARTAAWTGRALAVAVPLLALEGMNDGSFATPQELEARAQFMRNLGVVTGAMQAPVLAEEALASRQALKYMQQAGATRSQALRRGATRLLPAYLSYLAPAAAPFVAATLLRRRARARPEGET